MILYVLRSNYDCQGPTDFQDQTVITQLFNILRTLEVTVAMIEQNLSEDTVVGIPEPFKAKPVKEKTKTPPKDELSITHVPYADQTAPTAAQPYSSLVSV